MIKRGWAGARFGLKEIGLKCLRCYEFGKRTRAKVCVRTRQKPQDAFLALRDVYLLWLPCSAQAYSQRLRAEFNYTAVYVRPRGRTPLQEKRSFSRSL